MKTGKNREKQAAFEESRGFSRRQFVKMTGIGVLTVGFLEACSDSDDDDDDDGPGTQEPQPPVVTQDPSIFPQSVATGDPRPDSVVFWTRVQDDAAPGVDYNVRLVIGMDEALTDVVMDEAFTASVEYDGVIKVQVMQLSAGTTYYYQFQYEKDSNTLLASNIGRTRTAPDPESDTPVRFGFISCQDYTDSFYNSLVRMAEMDLDFVVHLGDYIYETTDGGTLKMDEVRKVVFEDVAGAIDFGDGTFAARSLANYRRIYKTYRTDPMLQRVHERFPMISTWDDHEFSNDSWKASGSYFGGVREEWDEERKRNAERAYAEFMPSAFGVNAQGQLAPGNETFYPNARIYQDFRFGQHVHLVMTDTRSFRPDHLVPEDAFPGAIAVNQSTLALALFSQGIIFTEEVRSIFDAYVSIDDAQYAPYKQVLIGMVNQQYQEAGMTSERADTKAAEAISGSLGINYVNSLLEVFNASQPDNALPLLTRDGLEVGVSYFMLGKTSLLATNGLGSRNFVVKDTYDLVAALAVRANNGASEDVLGQDQENWLTEVINNSSTTWRVVGTSISATSLVLDFRDNDQVPALFRQRFYLGVDQWDGFPNKRAQLFELFASHPQQNTVLISGDIHASHASRHGNGIFEFTVCGVSSEPFKGFMRGAVQGPPFTDVPGINELVEDAEALFMAGSPVIDEASGLKQMAFTRADVHGFSVIEADATGLTNTFHHLDEGEVSENQYESAELDGKFTEVKFEIRGGELEQIS